MERFELRIENPRLRAVLGDRVIQIAYHIDGSFERLARLEDIGERVNLTVSC